MNFINILTALKGATPFEIAVSVILFLFSVFIFRFKFIGKKAVDRSLKILRIKTIETLYEQMSVLESFHDQMVAKLTRAYNEATSRLCDQMHYKEIIKNIEKEVKGKVRKWFRENHYGEKTDEEFRIYVKEKIGMITDYVTYALDHKYCTEHFELSRNAVHDLNLELIPFITENYTTVFYKAREISKKRQEEIQRLENEKMYNPKKL